jgi:hypothetical protein
LLVADVPLIVKTRGANAMASGCPAPVVTPIATLSAVAELAPIRRTAQASIATTRL